MSTSTAVQNTPYINGPAPEEATGEVAKLYAVAAQYFGAVPDPARLLGLNPVVLGNQMRYMGYFRDHATLSFALLAAVRLIVAKRHHCKYCVDMSAALLINNAGWSLAQVDAAKEDHRAAPLPEREKALLGLVLKAVDDPSSVHAGDISALRELGWSERDIFDAVYHGIQSRANDAVLDTFGVLNY